MKDSLESRLQMGEERRRRGYNCCQTVLCTYADLLGEEEELLFRTAEGFGRGIGGSMQTCGSVTALVMAAGLLKSCGNLSACNSKPETMKLTRELMQAFQDLNGTVCCRELKGIDTGTVIRACPDCMDDGIRILWEKVFSGQETKQTNE